jgi:hypothetical protein
MCHKFNLVYMYNSELFSIYNCPMQGENFTQQRLICPHGQNPLDLA